MRYMGGKHRQSRRFAEEINRHIDDYSGYLEPFCGMCSVAQRVSKRPMVLADNHPYLIAMWRALQEGWRPPLTVSKEEYEWVKAHRDEDPALAGYLGFNLSFAGIWMAGYAAPGPSNHDHAGAGYRTSQKAINRLQDATFVLTSYETWEPEDLVIYCDPPYEDGEKHKGAGDSLNYENMWNTFRRWSKDNLVYVSGFSYPEDWMPVVTLTDVPVLLSSYGARDVSEYLVVMR